MMKFKDTRSLSPEAQEAIRIRAVRAHESGMSQHEVAQLLGVTRQMVSIWYQKYKRHGMDALKAKPQGRPAGTGTLEAEEEEHMIHLIDTYMPDELGLSYDLWTRDAVLELVQRELDVTVNVTTIGRWLKKWGFTPQKPARRAQEQKPEAVDH